jgi:CubicO group peptidase (beta-lactamase class C family)
MVYGERTSRRKGLEVSMPLSSNLLPATMHLLGFAALPPEAVQQTKSKPEARLRPPISGRRSPGVQFLDQVMLSHMERIGCSSATLAISFRGRLVHSRVYGWIDQEKKTATLPSTLIGIASCEKPITAAAIRQLAHRRKLSLDDEVVTLLHIKPNGKVVDCRIEQITLRNLLDHKSGWQGEPIKRAMNAARKSGEKDPLPVDVVLGFLRTERLSSDPGTEFEYCNFCYDTLRRVIWKTSKKTAADYFRTELFRPFGMVTLDGFASPDSRGEERGLSIVWNDRDGGPVSVTAPALCRFMQCFWLTREPRDQSNPTWTMYGSLPGSTALMLWRSDGINVAAVFNGRGDDSHEQIKNDLDAVIERLT